MNADHQERRTQTRSMILKKILIFLGKFIFQFFVDIIQYVFFILFILVFLVLFCASGYLTLQAYFALDDELRKIGNRKYQLKLKRMSKTNHLSEETINDSPYGGVIEF